MANNARLMKYYSKRYHRNLRIIGHEIETNSTNIVKISLILKIQFQN